MNFIPLHIYTGYSFLLSGIKISNLVSTSKKLNYKYLGISDLNSLFGLAEFNKVTKENNIKPVFGMELKLDIETFNLYCYNETGYRNLCLLSTLKEQNKENITFETIKRKSEGLILVYSSKNKLFLNLNNKENQERLKNILSTFSFSFIGLEIYNSSDVLIANSIREFAQINNYKLIAFPLIRYIKKDDAMILDMLDAIRKNTVLDENFSKYDGEYYFKSYEELKKYYTNEELEAHFDIFKNNDFDFSFKRGKLLIYDKNTDAATLLKQKILEGLKKRNISLENNPRYRNRLNYEFLTIKKMGYLDYFLIVQDYCLFAKRNNIPKGPGRGSAVASLIAYLLEITEIDPLKYNLLFERFLNPNRKSLPDIDVDFSDNKREDILTYIINKYGKEKCARVITFQTFGAKQALRDASKILSLAILGEELCKAIPNNYNQNKYDLKLAFNNIPAFKEKVMDNIDSKLIFKMAYQLEGLPRQKGLHAAGIVIDDENLFGKIPLTYLDENTLVTQYEKDYLEEQGFLKMDILSLINLSTIENCLNLIKQNKNIDINFDNIDLADPKIYKCLYDVRTMGIFQLDTEAATNALKIIKPTCFNDVVATISIDRPGPQKKIEPYARRKENKEKITYLDNRLIPILKETYGIIIYQEQVMQIASTLANFNMSEADDFRRVISKKDTEKMNKLKDEFIYRCIKNNVKKDVALTIFDEISEFAKYGFNKSHAVGYAYVALIQCYLKTYYPLEFYLSILDQQYGSNDIKFNKYLDEIKKFGLEVELPTINESSLMFKSHNNKLLMPLLGINKVNRNMVVNIINERERNGKYTSFYNFIYRMTNKEYNITSTQISKLVDAGCFDNFSLNRKALKMAIEEIIDSLEAYLMFNEEHEVKLKDVKDDPLMRIINEYEAVNVMISDSILNYVDKSNIDMKNVKTISELDFKNVSTIICSIRNIKSITVKAGENKGKPMAFVSLFDNTGEIEGTIFTSLYALVGDKIKVNDYVIVKGQLELRRNEKSLRIIDIKKGELKNE